MPKWTVEPGTICEECLKLPADLFLPGSSTEHRIYKGPNALERIQAAIRIECRLCIIIFDVLRAGSRVSDFVLDDQGILLKAEWTALEPDRHRERQYSWSAENNNRHLIEAKLYPHPREGKRQIGPLLSLRWNSTSVGQLRFNVEQAPPVSLKKRQLEYDNVRTHWDQNKRSGVFDPRETPPTRVPFPTNVDCPETSELINGWLDKCQADHGDTCAFVGDRVLSTGFSLPTRLLHCSEDTVFLIDSSTIPRDSDGFGPSYTALSYRWTESNLPLMTTNANIAAAYSGITLADLPQTFQHAVDITRKIKVSYIWIDALCIVQDDETDKDREIGVMDLIYSMAICLITATASADHYAGCFLPRGPNPDHHVRNLTLSMPLSKGPLTVTIQPYLADWGQALKSGLLSYRGWCFQERQMAKRIIHFTGNRILWECRSSIACEDRPEMTSEYYRGTNDVERPFRITWNRPTDRVMLNNDPERTGPWYREWYQAVEEYSAMELTNPTDRLAALAGLAAFFMQKLRIPDPKNHYLAGLWKMGFAEGLCWFPGLEARLTCLPGNLWPPPLKTVANGNPISSNTTLEEWLPSWSWISFSGGVQYNYLRATVVAADMFLGNGITFDVKANRGGLTPSYFPPKLTGVSIGYHSANSLIFGQIKNGFICMTSYYTVVTISEKHLIGEPARRGNKIRPKCYTMYPASSLSASLPWNRHRSPFAQGTVYFDADPERLSSIQIHCLRLGTGHSLFSGTDGVVDFGLALIEIKNPFPLDRTAVQPSPRMRRVGMFEIDIWNKRWTREAVEWSVIIV